MHTFNYSHLQPGTEEHVKRVLEAKHGREIEVVEIQGLSKEAVISYVVV